MCAIATSPPIETERLRLRAPAPGDAARITELVSDFDIPRMTTRMPWPYGLSDAEGFLDRHERGDLGEERVFAIDHPAEGLIGVIGVHQEGRFPELGYWLGKPYWGQGFATEAAKAVLKWTRDDWGRKLVMAGHFADNPASGSVLIKCGFLYTGEVRLKHSVARGELTPTRMMVWIA
jgi:RimJ/RimL family protein N-acetyltransferase